MVLGKKNVLHLKVIVLFCFVCLFVFMETEVDCQNRPASIQYKFNKYLHNKKKYYVYIKNGVNDKNIH